MSDTAISSEWYYVGHYGQLGPLTLEQMIELAQDGVIAQDTFVWKPGMSEWRQANEVSELRTSFFTPATQLMPPPAPPNASRNPMTPPGAPPAAMNQVAVAQGGWNYLANSVPKSDKNRVTGGLLNLLPGFGRFYLGYAAHGALQLLTSLFCGIGFIWSIIDGIYILMGGVKYDGYGRILED